MRHPLQSVRKRKTKKREKRKERKKKEKKEKRRTKETGDEREERERGGKSLREEEWDQKREGVIGSWVVSSRRGSKKDTGKYMYVALSGELCRYSCSILVYYINAEV